jgi:hypothetical protein
MHLLKLEDNGEFSRVKYFGKNIPPYAILSHTWGEDHDEVSFRDLTEGKGKDKAGYQKLTFCAKQATDDGLKFFWVDTCCIDQLSSAELSEAIQSMFRWYHDSAKCYVYLSDVTTSGFANNDPSFQQSRWFTRGWTLQELLAPTCVEFFSKGGDRLGNKDSLVIEIAGITGISVQALQGSPLHSFSVEERMKWAANRVTKREEDMAYSLLGIFDIGMSLRYGEGSKKSWERLKWKISKASTSERTLPSLLPVAMAAKTKPAKELKKNDPVEASWRDIMKRRKEDDCCFNCGSAHWEHECPLDCGRCKSFTSTL